MNSVIAITASEHRRDSFPTLSATHHGAKRAVYGAAAGAKKFTPVNKILGVADLWRFADHQCSGNSMRSSSSFTRPTVAHIKSGWYLCA